MIVKPNFLNYFTLCIVKVEQTGSAKSFSTPNKRNTISKSELMPNICVQSWVVKSRIYNYLKVDNTTDMQINIWAAD